MFKGREFETCRSPSMKSNIQPLSNRGLSLSVCLTEFLIERKIKKKGKSSGRPLLVFKGGATLPNPSWYTLYYKGRGQSSGFIGVFGRTALTRSHSVPTAPLARSVLRKLTIRRYILFYFLFLIFFFAKFSFSNFVLLQELSLSIPYESTHYQL